MKKLFLFAAVAVSLLTIDLAALDIVKDGKPAAVIVLGRRTKATLLALEVLQTSVEKCTGAKLQMIRPKDLSKVPADLNRIFIGDCNYAAGKNLKSSDLKVEEYLIKADGKDLFLLANDKEAPHWKTTGAPGTREPNMDFRQYSPAHLWAVAELLDRHAKVRFLWPGEGGAYYPKQRTISIPDGYFFKDRPAFVRRHIWFGAGTYSRILPETNKYMMIHRQGSRVESLFVDGFGEYWERFSAKKPELFALSPEGKRTYLNKPDHVKLCLSNPEVAEIILDDWRKAGRPDNWSMCPNDGHGFCTCKNCRAWDAPEFAPQDDAYWNRKQIPVSRTRFSLLKIVEGEGNRVPSVSDRYCRFYMEVLKKAGRYNPNVNLLAYAYGNYVMPPKHIKLDPRIVIGYVGTPIFPMTPEKMAASKKDWNAWVATGCSMMYRPNSTHSQGCLPLQYTRQLAGEYRMALHTPGLKRVHFDALRGEFAAQGLMYYTIVRLTQHPEMTPEQIEDEYFSMFGKAEADVRKYHELWQKFSDSITMEDIRSWEKNTGMKYNLWVANDFFAEHIKPELFTESIKILNAAAEKADTARAKSETAFLLVGVKHAQLTDKMLKAHIANLDAPSPEAARYLKKCQRELAAFRGKHEKLGISNMQLLNRREKRGLRLSQQRKKK